MGGQKATTKFDPVVVCCEELSKMDQQLHCKLAAGGNLGPG